MARKRITDYKFTPGISYTGNKFPNGWALVDANTAFMKAEVAAFITAKQTEGLGDWASYTYDADKCARDVAYVIDGIQNDLRYGGNEKTYKNAQKYWDDDTPQLDGTRQPEIDVYTFLKGLIANNILLKTAQSTPYQSATPQVTTGNDAESGAATRTNELTDIIINVITSGLTQLPTLAYNEYSRIKIPLRVQLEQVLLISNVKRGSIYYNFTDTNLLADV